MNGLRLLKLSHRKQILYKLKSSEKVHSCLRNKCTFANTHHHTIVSISSKGTTESPEFCIWISQNIIISPNTPKALRENEDGNWHNWTTNSHLNEALQKTNTGYKNPFSSGGMFFTKYTFPLWPFRPNAGKVWNRFKRKLWKAKFLMPLDTKRLSLTATGFIEQ